MYAARFFDPSSVCRFQFALCRCVPWMAVRHIPLSSTPIDPIRQQPLPLASLQPIDAPILSLLLCGAETLCPVILLQLAQKPSLRQRRGVAGRRRPELGIPDECKQVNISNDVRYRVACGVNAISQLRSRGRNRIRRQDERCLVLRRAHILE